MSRGGLLMAVDGVLLVYLWPTARRAAGVLSELDSAIPTHGVDAALGSLAGGALWLVAAWLAAGLVAAEVATLPGRTGRLAEWLADRLVPGALQRIVAGSAGLGVLLAPVAAAARPGGPATPPPTSVSSSATVPTPGWPLDQPGAPAHPGRPVAPARPEPPRSATPGPVEPERITVRPGDSLWLIAGRRIGGAPSPARVAAEWPRWYAANEEVIGPDPGLLRPGQVLHAPPEPSGAGP